ncbi:DUF6415 family natural product biosynthesis protein [Streptomyces sp. ADMS]|uniref:DUF6415 family natural product biosynthesis protein n=1 Tax=Streptomyces sp. ADMS TaxID=3071415 RepID=UPI0039925CC8
MRATARRVLGPDDRPDSLPPAPAELDTLTATLRGHMELLIPEVEKAAGKLDRESIPATARSPAWAKPAASSVPDQAPGPAAGSCYARRFSRSLNALCEHYGNVSSGLPGAS